VILTSVQYFAPVPAKHLAWHWTCHLHIHWLAWLKASVWVDGRHL